MADSVRLVALERVTDRNGRDTAKRLAAQDPSAKVRAWAHKLHGPPPPDSETQLPLADM